MGVFAVPYGFARLRGRNQLTLPQGVVDKMELRSGDLVEFAATKDGGIEIHPARIVTVGTPEAKREEAAAQEDIRQGRYSVITSMDEFRGHLEQVRSGEYPSANSSHLTDLQRQEVEAVVEAILKKFHANAAASPSILREDAQDSMEQR
jgi:AbrB family looped-hinge helix DNA binding protein